MQWRSGSVPLVLSPAQIRFWSVAFAAAMTATATLVAGARLATAAVPASTL